MGSPFEQTLRPRQQKKMMIEQLAPLRDRILCMVGGNHERRTTKDTDESPSYDIACKLDLEDVYRETAAFMKIQMGDSRGNGLTNPCYTFCVTHGAGSSIYTTNSAMRAERFGMAIDGMDMLIVGHIHKPQDFPVFKYVIDKYNNKVTKKPYNVFVCTSWMENGAYCLQSLMQPTGHSLSHFTLNGTKKEIEFSRKCEY